MKRGRILFWSVSGLIMAAVGGASLCLYIASQQVQFLPADRAEVDRRGREAAARDDHAPEPWTPADPWWKSVTIDAFDRVTAGKKWPSARRAVVALGAELASGPQRTGDESADAVAAADLALSYGCDDPAVLWAAGRYLLADGPPGMREEAAGFLAKAGDAFAAPGGGGSGYPAFVRCLALYEVAENAARMPHAVRNRPARAAESAAAAAALLPEVGADRTMPRAAVLLLTQAAGEASEAMRRDRSEMLDPVIAALEAGGQPPSTIATARGVYQTNLAWDARGTTTAGGVTKAGWKGFAEGLAKARNSLTEAWEADNSNGQAAAAMLTVCMGESATPQETEKWFKRAMAADAGNYDACRRMMTLLEPKWGGSVEEVIGFAREMAAVGASPTADPRTVRLPLTLVNAYWNFAGGGKAPQPDLFAKVPDVWTDISGVYETFLARVPNSRYHRTRYAVIAGWAGQWDVAAAQFEKLGDKYSKEVVEENVLQALREQAKRKKKASTQPA